MTTSLIRTQGAFYYYEVDGLAPPPVTGAGWAPGEQRD